MREKLCSRFIRSQYFRVFGTLNRSPECLPRKACVLAMLCRDVAPGDAFSGLAPSHFSYKGYNKNEAMSCD